jgi:hypothetical protein
VLAIQPRGHDSGDEELRAVGVGTSVSHGQEERTVVLQLEVFILELFTVDGLALKRYKRVSGRTLGGPLVKLVTYTGTVEVGEVTTLELMDKKGKRCLVRIPSESGRNLP